MPFMLIYYNLTICCIDPNTPLLLISCHIDFQLMRKEREYLAKVSADWEAKKRYIEEAVVFNVENSQTVLDSLNTAAENLRMREHKLKEKELKVISKFVYLFQKIHLVVISLSFGFAAKKLICNFE